MEFGRPNQKNFRCCLFAGKTQQNKLSTGQNSLHAHFTFHNDLHWQEPCFTLSFMKKQQHYKHFLSPFKKDPPFLSFLVNSLLKLLMHRTFYSQIHVSQLWLSHDQKVCSQTAILFLSPLSPCLYLSLPLLWISRKTCWDLLPNSIYLPAGLQHKGTCCAPGYVLCLCFSFLISAILYSHLDKQHTSQQQMHWDCKQCTTKQTVSSV